MPSNAMAISGSALPALLSVAVCITRCFSAANAVPIDPPITGNCVSGSYPMYDKSRWITDLPSSLKLPPGLNTTRTDFVAQNHGEQIRFEKNAVYFDHGNPPSFGVVRAAHSRYVHYGKISMRIAASTIRGMCTTFITYSDTKDEIDMEIWGSVPDKVAMNSFSKERFCGASPWGAVPNYGDFHTYEIDWKRTSITWKVDGRLVRSVVPGSDAAKMPSVNGLPANPLGLGPSDPSLVIFAIFAWGADNVWKTDPIRNAGYANLTIQCYDASDKPVPEWPVGSKDYVYPGEPYPSMYSIIPDGDVVCTKWRATQAGETCWSTWTKVAKLVEKDFLRLNPGVDCNALTNATYLCVEGDLKGKAKAVPNPSWEKVCTDTRTVQTGETCWSVWTKAGLTDVEFYSLNPGIDCNLLIPSISKVCLKRDYVTPSVTTPSATSTSTTAKALAIPTIAVVSAPPCAAYHIVEDGETCYTIWTNAGLSNTEFLALNPTVDCGWLQVGGTSVCTKRGDGPSSASTTIGAAPTASTTAKATTTPKPPSSINPRVTGNCVSGTFPLNNPSSWIINEKAAPGSSFPFEHDPSKYPMMGTGQGISFESDRVSFTHQNPPNNNVIIGVHTRWIRYAKITLRVAASAVPGLHVSVKTDSQTGDVIVADFSPAMPNMMAPNALFKNRLCGPANWGIVPQFTNLHTLEFDWKRSSLAWKVDGVAQRTLIPGSAAAKATAPGWQANPTGELPKDPSLFMFSLSVNGAVDTNRYPISSRSASFADLTIQCYDNNDKAVPEWPVGAKDYTYPGAVAKRDVADGEMFEPAELDLVQMMIERRSENVETATEDEMSVPGPASFRMGAPAARLRATPKCTTHLVRAGEGCEDIAGIYRISVADYKEWNNESQCPPEEGSVVCVSSSVVKRGRRSNVDEL